MAQLKRCGALHLLPPKPNVCQICASDHEPEEPHNMTDAMIADKNYRIGHVRPSDSIEWLDRLYTKEEAMRQCDAANYVEMGGRMFEAVGHSATDGQDSGFRWVYEEVKNQ